MNRLLAFLVILVLCVVAIGFYRNWFTVAGPQTDTESQKVNVGVTLDPDKVKADAETVKERARELTGQGSEGAKGSANQPTEELQTNEK